MRVVCLSPGRSTVIITSTSLFITSTSLLSLPVPACYHYQYQPVYHHQRPNFETSIGQVLESDQMHRIEVDNYVLCMYCTLYNIFHQCEVVSRRGIGHKRMTFGNIYGRTFRTLYGHVVNNTLNMNYIH